MRLKEDLLPCRAWFVVGYPKGNIPRLESDITEVKVHESGAHQGKIEVKFENVKEAIEE